MYINNVNQQEQVKACNKNLKEGNERKMNEFTENNPIEELGEILKTLNITDPYTVLDAKKLENILLCSVAAKFDWTHQCSELSAIIELYQEHYCSAEWSTILKVPEETEDELHDASSVLHSLKCKFDNHEKVFTKRFNAIMKVFLSAPKKVKNDVLGCNLNVNPKGIDEWLDKLNERLGKAPYNTRPDENYCTFLEVLKEMNEEDEECDDDINKYM